ncbi:MAG TPA: ATP-binding cassette domain-containing protein, partial [Thermoanaerobaculia bacterium]
MAQQTEPNKIIYSMVGVSKYHGKKQVLKDIYLSYFYGAKIGVLGLNGSGKSTLLRILAGIDKEHLGETVLSPGYTVGLLEQEPQLDPSKTVLEIVQEGVQPVLDLLKEFDDINNAFGDPDADMDKLMDRQAKVQDKLDATGAWDLDSKLDMAMDALRCPPGETLIGTLSGGEKRRVALCRLLLQAPDILLLDEPTNHLDAESVQWLEQHLQKYAGTVIAVTHDRYFLDNVAGWILELDRGEGIPWKGNYSSWLEQKRNRLAQEEKAESNRQKTLDRELEWIKMSPKARHAKGKARINAYENLLNQESRERVAELEIYIPAGPRLGGIVVESDNVAGWILELDRGRGLPYEGNYSSWLEQKQKRLAQEEKTEKARQKTIAAELDWVRQNPKGRQTKQKARLQNFEALVAQERNVKLDEVQIHIPAGPRLGDLVVQAEHLRKGFGDKLLIDDLSF